jgi:hypothetical protein
MTPYCNICRSRNFGDIYCYHLQRRIVLNNPQAQRPSFVGCQRTLFPIISQLLAVPTSMPHWQETHITKQTMSSGCHVKIRTFMKASRVDGYCIWDKTRTSRILRVFCLFIYLLTFTAILSSVTQRFPNSVPSSPNWILGFLQWNRVIALCSHFAEYSKGFFFFFNSGLWGYCHCGHSWPILSASGDSEDDCGEADGM